jgi:diguanylate cyclase (GGDEF)-like protein/PAS domain S-box-containing protein
LDNVNFQIVISELRKQMMTGRMILSPGNLLKKIFSSNGSKTQKNIHQKTDWSEPNREFLALQSASQVISSSLDLDDVLYAVNKQLTTFLGTTGCTISEWDPLDDTITQISGYGQQSWEDDSKMITYQLEEYPLTRNVIEKRQGEQMTISQSYIDTNELTIMQNKGIKALLMLPMVYHDQVLGLVEIVDANVERKFTEAEIALTQLLANQAAIAIENARLHTEMQKRLVEQSALRETATTLLSTLNTEKVLTRIAEQMAKTLAGTSAYILLFEKEKMKVQVLAEYITQQACAAERISDLGESYGIEYDENLLDCLQAGKTDIAQVNDPDLAETDLEHMRKYGAKTILYIPLQVKGELVAYAELWESRFQRTFTKAEISLCQGIAQQAAIAIQNARLFKEAQEEIRQRKQAEFALRESEERYALAAQAANDGLWDWNLATNEVYFSQRWMGIIGFEVDEISNHPKEWLDRIHPDDKENVEVKLYTHMEGLTPQFKNEHRIKHKNGTYRWVLCRGVGIQDEDGSCIRMTGSMTDITERKQIEEQLTHNAFHDTLTGLPNRALFLDRLNRSVERTKRLTRYKYSILFLDFDRFKQINDSYGHSTGDRLLTSIAKRLSNCLRSVDTIARLGGDEFAVLLEDLDHEGGASYVAERILMNLKEPFHLDGHQIYISASVGIVNSNSGYVNADEVLRDADIAMYHAKAMGKSRYANFDPSMRDQVIERLQMENDLRIALERNELELLYQPIIKLNSGHITGFEALLRWLHPKQGSIPPAGFIPLAEETGLVIPIGKWVLEEASRQLHQWQLKYPMDPPLSMNVNISSKQLTQPDFIEQVEKLITSGVIEYGSLRLEITESVIMENTASAEKLLKRLQSLGVQIEMDDFGTGYSSLNYLHRFPIGAIKIDRYFINQMDNGTNNSDIVRIILNMARDLGLRAVAEGIETHTQLARLRELECKYGQGFLFSKPVDSVTAESFIEVTQDSRNLIKLIDQAKISTM